MRKVRNFFLVSPLYWLICGLSQYESFRILFDMACTGLAVGVVTVAVTFRSSDFGVQVFGLVTARFLVRPWRGCKIHRVAAVRQGSFYSSSLWCQR